MDRTKDLLFAAERFLETASLPPEQARQLREAVILGRRSRPPTSIDSFPTAAKGVEDSVRTLWDSIRSMQQEYATSAGALATPDPSKDVNEVQIAGVIKQIGSYIERLKQAAASKQRKDGSRVNEHTAAHMHGVVLILAERLHRASMCFDRLRAARYQALVDGRPPGAASPPPPPARATRPGGPSTAAGGDGWPHLLGLHLAGPKGHEAGPPREGGMGAEGAGGGWPVQVQGMEQENKALLERLTATRNTAVTVEQSVRDVAALTQMFSTAVLAQAETIESIYMAAVEATHHITAGNEALTKTVAINRSTTRYIVVLLLVATVCLLFFDWFNS